MPAGDTPIQGFEVFTQRASNDGARRGADDADRREFAALVDDARHHSETRPADNPQPQKTDAQTAEKPTQAPHEPKASASSTDAQNTSTDTATTPPEVAQTNPAAPAPSLGASETRSHALPPHLLTQLQQQTPAPQQPVPATQPAAAPATGAEQTVVPPSLTIEATNPAQAHPATINAASNPAAPAPPEAAAALTATPAATTAATSGVEKQLAPATPLTSAASNPQRTAQIQPAAPPAPESGPGANRLAASLNAPTPTAEAGSSANAGTTSQLQPQTGNSQQSAASAATQNGAAPKKPAAIGAPVIDAPAPSSQTGSGQVSTPSISTATASPAAASSTAASAPSAPPPALAGATPAVVQVYSRMVERFDGKAQQFQIRLDPPELGRVNVRIEIGADHRVHAVLAAHDSNALADLMRGQRALEQSLANAGIDLSDEGIRFELSDQNTNQSSRGDQDAAPKKQAQPWMLDADTSAALEQAVAQQSRWSRSRVNVVA